MGLKVLCAMLLMAVFAASGQENKSPANITTSGNTTTAPDGIKGKILETTTGDAVTMPQQTGTEIVETDNSLIDHERTRREARRNKKRFGGRRNKPHKNKNSIWDKVKNVDKIFNRVETGLHAYEVLTNFWDRIHPDVHDAE